MKSDYGFKATGDTIAPYGSIEKKLKDGKVEITVFSADDESDVDEIILPDGTSKKIQYETESILLRGRYLEEEGNGKRGIVQNFKQVTIDSKNKINDVNEANKYNVIVDLNSYGWPVNCDFLNECFKKGKNILSSGNDVDDSIIIVDKAWYVKGNYNVDKEQENEVTKFYNQKIGGDAFWRIKFNDNVNIWATATINGNTTDALGEYVSENGNRWIHKQVPEYGIESLFYRNAIYRITGSRSATYIADKNGVYTFKIKDLAGNKTEISTEVNEL